MSGRNHHQKKDLFFTESTGKKVAIGGIVFIFFAALLFVLFGSWSFTCALNEEKLGQFGDFIGGVIGSLFSLAGVILFYVALKEQRRDININQENLKLQTTALNHQVEEFREQKEELIETRKVYEEQTTLIREQTNLYKQQNKELKEQTNTAKLQQFESSFFSYLNMFIELKKILDLKAAGSNYFDQLYSELLEIDSKGMELVETFELVQNKYLEVFHENKDKLSHYFKTLYRIIVLIDSSPLEDERKSQYFKLLRSQLSDSELLILYYNYHSHLGVKVRPYIIKYSILKHIRILDKIEMGANLRLREKFDFEEFLANIGAYIVRAVERYKSLEETEDIDLSMNTSMLGINVDVKLKINTEFNFSLFFNKQDFEALGYLSRQEFEKLVKRQIYSVLFLTKFKLPDEKGIIIFVAENNTSFDICFKIENIQNI